MKPDRQAPRLARFGVSILDRTKTVIVLNVGKRHPSLQPRRKMVGVHAVQTQNQPSGVPGGSPGHQPSQPDQIDQNLTVEKTFRTCLVCREWDCKLSGHALCAENGTAVNRLCQRLALNYLCQRGEFACLQGTIENRKSTNWFFCEGVCYRRLAEDGGSLAPARARERGRYATANRTVSLSHRMYSLISFRKSTPPQSGRRMVYYY